MRVIKTTAAALNVNVSAGTGAAPMQLLTSGHPFAWLQVVGEGARSGLFFVRFDDGLARPEIGFIGNTGATIPLTYDGKGRAVYLGRRSLRYVTGDATDTSDYEITILLGEATDPVPYVPDEWRAGDLVYRLVYEGQLANAEAVTLLDMTNALDCVGFVGKRLGSTPLSVRATLYGGSLLSGATIFDYPICFQAFHAPVAAGPFYAPTYVFPGQGVGRVQFPWVRGTDMEYSGLRIINPNAAQRPSSVTLVAEVIAGHLDYDNSYECSVKLTAAADLNPLLSFCLTSGRRSHAATYFSLYNSDPAKVFRVSDRTFIPPGDLGPVTGISGPSVSIANSAVDVAAATLTTNSLFQPGGRSFIVHGAYITAAPTAGSIVTFSSQAD